MAIAILWAALFVVAPLAVMAAPALGETLGAGPEYPICTATDKQMWPRIDGQTVVWEDFRLAPLPANVWGVGGAPPAEFRIDSPYFDQIPDVSGDFVVYTGDHLMGTNHNVWVTQLSTMRAVAASTDPHGQYDPAVDGNLVVWEDFRDASTSGDVDIYGATFFFQLTDPPDVHEAPICVARSVQCDPHVSGDIVVWEDYRDDPGTRLEPDIYARDMRRGVTFAICKAPWFQGEPSIDGRYVVWQDERDGEPDIYACDLTDRSVFPVAADTNVAETDPEVEGTVVVYQAEGDIRACDLATGSDASVCAAAGWQYHPDVWGTRVVWEDARAGIDDIDVYGADLTGVPDWTAAVVVDDGEAFTRVTSVDVTLSGRHLTRATTAWRSSLDGTTWGDWQPLAAGGTVSLDTAPDGVVTVWAQFEDDQGGVSPAVSDQITLDRVGPTTRAARAAYVRRGRTANLRYRVEDALSPYADVTIRVRRLNGRLAKTLRPGLQPCATALAASFRCTLSKGTYRYTVNATDLAGNRQVTAGSNRLVVR